MEVSNTIREIDNGLLVLPSFQLRYPSVIQRDFAQFIVDLIVNEVVQRAKLIV